MRMRIQHLCADTNRLVSIGLTLSWMFWAWMSWALWWGVCRLLVLKCWHGPGINGCLVEKAWGSSVSAKNSVHSLYFSGFSFEDSWSFLSCNLSAGIRLACYYICPVTYNSYIVSACKINIIFLLVPAHFLVTHRLPNVHREGKKAIFLNLTKCFFVQNTTFYVQLPSINLDLQLPSINLDGSLATSDSLGPWDDVGCSVFTYFARAPCPVTSWL